MGALHAVAPYTDSSLITHHRSTSLREALCYVHVLNHSLKTIRNPKKTGQASEPAPHQSHILLAHSQRKYSSAMHRVDQGARRGVPGDQRAQYPFVAGNGVDNRNELTNCEQEEEDR